MLDALTVWAESKREPKAKGDEYDSRNHGQKINNYTPSVQTIIYSGSKIPTSGSRADEQSNSGDDILPAEDEGIAWPLY